MAGANNQYRHPHEETLIRLNDAQVDTYVTFEHGTIVITTDGQTYNINVKQPYQYTPPKESIPDRTAGNASYVGSVNSDKYHYPECRHAKSIKAGNQVWFDSVEEAKKAGYVPCGACKPPQ